MKSRKVSTYRLTRGQCFCDGEAGVEPQTISRAWTELSDFNDVYLGFRPVLNPRSLRFRGG